MTEANPERTCTASMTTGVAKLRAVKYDAKKNVHTVQFEIPADPGHAAQWLRLRDQMCYLSAWRYEDQGLLAVEQIPKDPEDEQQEDPTMEMFE